MTPEGRVKSAFRKTARLSGLLAFPLVVCTHRGIPDLIAFPSGGIPALVEFKRPEGGVVSEYQKIRIAEFRKLGYRVYLIESESSAKSLARDLSMEGQ